MSDGMRIRQHGEGLAQNLRNARRDEPDRDDAPSKCCKKLRPPTPRDRSVNFVKCVFDPHIFSYNDENGIKSSVSFWHGPLFR